MDKFNMASSACAEAGRACAHKPLAVVRMVRIPAIGLGHPLVDRTSHSRPGIARASSVGRRSVGSKLR